MITREEGNFFHVISSQSNLFIESPLAQEFSEQELKTLEFIITQLTKEDRKLVQNQQIKVIHISVTKFAKMIRAHPNDLYKRADELASNMINKKIKFKFIDNSGKKGFEVQSFFTSFSYRDGALNIGINPFVLPYFLDLEEEFTKVNFENILRIGSSYGIKLYKLLKQYENMPQKYRKFSITELRNQFGIGNEIDSNGKYLKYHKYSNFKQRVLETAKNHINKHTDIQMDYSEEKTGKSITSISFYIKSKLTQLQQAKIEFYAFMDNLEPGSLLKIAWDKTPENKRIDLFEHCFKVWLENSVVDYIPNSTDMLVFESEDSLIYPKNEILKKMYIAYRGA